MRIVRVTRRARVRARPVARYAKVPALFGGPVGGRRPVFLDEVALGDDITGFNPSVEAWRQEIADQAGTLPVNFLLMWVQVESNGNPCSWTSLKEAGIYQLMYPDNIMQGGTTLEQQHPVPPCVANAQTTAYRSSLSDDQAYEQVRGGIQYVNYCRDVATKYLDQYGYSGQPGWTTSDWSYWAMVKMVHVLPGRIPGMLQAGIDGNGGNIPADWDQMATYATNVPANWLDNARRVGLLGQGGGTVFNKQYMIYGALAAGALALVYLAKKQSRRVAH